MPGLDILELNVFIMVDTLAANQQFHPGWLAASAAALVDGHMRL